MGARSMLVLVRPNRGPRASWRLRGTRRALAAGAAFAAGLGLAVAGASSASAGSAAGGQAAAQGVASGGPVIVVLSAQHANLNLRSQAARLRTADDTSQAAVLSSIKSSGGTNIIRLTAPDAVAATVSAAEVKTLEAMPGVAEVVPDVNVSVQPEQPAATGLQYAAAQPAPTVLTPASQRRTATVTPAAADAHPLPATRSAGTTTSLISDPPFVTHTIPASCPARPVQEPEAVADIHASTGNPNSPDMANSIATGQGVIIANQGLNELAGNPNFQRPDGQHVIINAPNYTLDQGSDETYEDASSEAAQGTVDYQYSQALPGSTISPTCEFYIEGVAPGASLVDLTGIDTPILPEADVIAGIDNTVSTVHADVISESFGEPGTLPTESRSINLLDEADEAAVKAGVFVVSSSGDDGPNDTQWAPSDDPAVVGAAGVDNFHILALYYGYPSYVSNNMAAQSSGGTAPNGKLPDLAASDWHGGMAPCAPVAINGCTGISPTEVAAGTSEAAPLIAGAAADVIQAYRDTHNGTSPTPAMITDLLTSTATNINAPADEQGHGLLNVYAAVRAAQQMPGTTYTGPDRDAQLIASTTQTDSAQIDVTGNGGSSSTQDVSIYNTGSRPVTVHGMFRTLGPERQIGRVLSENITAPPAGSPIPPTGDQAAAPIHFRVPPGLDRLDTDMIWPDPTNSNVVAFDLFNPQGALVQQSYNDGEPPRTAGGTGSSPDIQHAEVSDPTPGVWTAEFFWPVLDDLVAVQPPAPGSYRGPMQFKVSGQDYQTAPATRPVTIASHQTVTVPVTITVPSQIGDHPGMLMFAGSPPSQFGVFNGPSVLIPVSRRTLIPANGGRFATTIVASVGRDVGQVSSYQMNVPAGRASLNARFSTADTSADNTYTYYLVAPDGTIAATGSSPTTVNGQPSGLVQLTVTDPAAGTWEVYVVLDRTTSGKEFTQTVHVQVSDGGGIADQVRHG